MKYIIVTDDGEAFEILSNGQLKISNSLADLIRDRVFTIIQIREDCPVGDKTQIDIYSDDLTWIPVDERDISDFEPEPDSEQEEDDE